MSPQVTTSRRRVRYAAVAALPQPLSSFPPLPPPVWPLRSSRPPPLLGNEARLPPCACPDRVCPGSCRRPWGLPGAGSGGMRGAGPGPRAPAAGSSRGSIDVSTAGAEPWWRGGGGQGPRPPAGVAVPVARCGCPRVPRTLRRALP